MTKIRSIRESLGLSQIDFARAVNTHPSNASRLETGATKAGKVMRARVAGALDAEPDELFDENGWPLEVEVVSAI